MNDKQHQEDTKYVQWQDGMYVMLDDLADPLDEQCYDLAVVEDSLRRSVYFKGAKYFAVFESLEDKLGVIAGWAGYWGSDIEFIKLTRAQALYIATGETDI
jgi:hypothetical protein